MTAVNNLVQQITTTNGTSNLTLSALTGGFQTFAGAFGTGGTTNVFYYFISSQVATEWEVGSGHMSDATTLVRDTVIASSNANALVNFSAGIKNIMCDLPASLQGVILGFTNVATAGGTADAITATYTPALTLSDNMFAVFAASAANATTTPTFSPNGLTAHTITKRGGAALVAGDIPAAGAVCIVNYNLANTRWELANPAKVSVTASDITNPTQLFDGGTVGGTANAITLTPTPSLAAYAAKDTRTFIVGTTNTSGTVTVAVSGLATRNIKKFIGGAVCSLAVGDLIAGTIAHMIDDGTQYLLLNPSTYTQSADVASATTTNLDTATGDYVNITGTTAITGITLAQGREMTVKFSGALTLTNGASLILPGAANITTAAGDTAIFRGEAAGVVRCVMYHAAASKAPLLTVGTAANNLVQLDGAAKLPAVDGSQLTGVGGGGFTGGGYAAGRYISGLFYGTAGFTKAMTANRIYFLPFRITSSATFTKIGLQVTTLSAGNARLGIYNVANGIPTTLVLDAGTVSTGTTGEKEITISQALTPKDYFLAVVYDATPTVNAILSLGGNGGTGAGVEFLGGATGGSANYYYAYAAFTYAALLATWSGALTYDNTDNNAPFLWMRV